MFRLFAFLFILLLSESVEAQIINPPSGVVAVANGGTGQSTANSSINTFNLSAQTLPHFRTCLTRVINGSGANCRIMFAGDSTVAGFGSSGTSEQTTNAIPSQLVNRFNQYGIPARSDCFFGTSYGPLRYNASALITAYTGGWTNSLDDSEFFSTIGGWIYENAGSAGNFTIKTNKNADTLTVWVWDASVAVLGTSVDGAGVVNHSLTNTGSIHTVTVSLSSVASHSVNMTWISGGTLRVIGWEFSNSTLPEVEICNAGWQGSKTSDWTSQTAFASDFVNVIKTLAPDVTIIQLGINDIFASVSLATTQANLHAMYVAAAGGSPAGDVAFISENPISGTTSPTQASLDTTIDNEALTDNVPAFSEFNRWQSYTISNALGLYFDTVHPNNNGYTDLSRFIFNAVNGI